MSRHRGRTRSGRDRLRGEGLVSVGVEGEPGILPPARDVALGPVRELARRGDPEQPPAVGHGSGHDRLGTPGRGEPADRRPVPVYPAEHLGDVAQRAQPQRPESPNATG